MDYVCPELRSLFVFDGLFVSSVDSSSYDHYTIPFHWVKFVQLRLCVQVPAVTGLSLCRRQP